MSKRRKVVALQNDLRGHLARNIEALMDARLELDSQTKIAEKAGVSQSTVGRAYRGEAGTRLETVEALASAFDLDPWQLLWPSLKLKPGSPPKAEAAAPQFSKRELEDVERARQALAKLTPAQRDLFVRDGIVAELLNMAHAPEARVAQVLGVPPSVHQQPAQYKRKS